MLKDNKTRFKLHLLKGLEMEAPTSRPLVHYIGISLVICAAAFLINSLADAGVFN